MRFAEVVESGAVGFMRELLRHIIDEKGEMPHALLHHGIDFPDERIVIFITRIFDREAGADRVIERDAGALRLIEELAEARQVFVRIRFAPAGAVVRIVLRRVEEGVEAHLSA